MSDMQLQAAIRFKVAEVADVNEAYEKAKELFGKEADELDGFDGEVDYFLYEKENNDGFTASVINNTLYIDYFLADDRDASDVDFGIHREEILPILDKYKEKFGSLNIDWKIKVLYYYNGACAGLSEVE